MTCGRTDHTKFASAGPTPVLSPLTNVPAGTYDNKATLCRERWVWNAGTKRVELCHQMPARALAEPDSLGIAWPRWGTYPDLPRGGPIGDGPVYTFGDAE